MKSTPQSVVKARLAGDYEKLSSLGKLGAKAKARRAAARLARMIRESEHMALEANEDICPVND